MLLDREPASELERQTPLQPSPFFIDFEAWPPPDDQVTGAPILVSYFIARVEEVEEDQVSVRLWELTGGGEALTTLDQDQLSEPATSGDLLRLWTWFELPGSGQISEHVYGLVQKPGFDEADRLLRDKTRALLELKDGEWS